MPTDNMHIWHQVEKTNPAHTKHVNQRGGFTAISANYQIMRATEVFGPIGVGWGYTTGNPIIVETLVMVPVSLWHGSRENCFGPTLGCEEWKDSKGRIDSDAPKKAVTDGVTKLLSQLGFNADVFLGRFDDQKYVAQMKAEFAGKEAANEQAPASVQLALDDIAACDTQPLLKQWWDRNSQAIPDSHYQQVLDAFNARIAAVKTLDMARAA